MIGGSGLHLQNTSGSLETKTWYKNSDKELEDPKILLIIIFYTEETINYYNLEFKLVFTFPQKVRTQHNTS